MCLCIYIYIYIYIYHTLRNDVGVVVACRSAGDAPRRGFVVFILFSERDSLTTFQGMGSLPSVGQYVAASSGMARRAVAPTLRPNQLWNNRRLQVLAGDLLLLLLVSRPVVYYAFLMLFLMFFQCVLKPKMYLAYTRCSFVRNMCFA